MNLHDTTSAFDNTFRAKKSTFSFGDIIYCMGSSISNSDNAYSTHTTLYQTLVPINYSPLVYINGVVDTISHSYPSAKNNLSIKDSWGNAYILFGGNDSLYIKRELRDNLVNNSNHKKLFYRTYDCAYLSHGKSPINKKYNYAVLLQPSQKSIDRMMNTENPVIQVLRQDDSAHVIYNTEKGIFGYSFFKQTSDLKYNRSIIKRVYSPSILMETVGSGSSVKTIVFADPDLRRACGDAEKFKGDTLFGLSKLDSVDVKGKYKLIGGDINDVTIKYLGANISRIYINASEGRTYSVQIMAIAPSAKAAALKKDSLAINCFNSSLSAGDKVNIRELGEVGE